MTIAQKFPKMIFPNPLFFKSLKQQKNQISLETVEKLQSLFTKKFYLDMANFVASSSTPEYSPAVEQLASSKRKESQRLLFLRSTRQQIEKILHVESPFIQAPPPQNHSDSKKGDKDKTDEILIKIS